MQLQALLALHATFKSINGKFLPAITNRNAEKFYFRTWVQKKIGNEEIGS
jgi:hypothetical protein